MDVTWIKLATGLFGDTKIKYLRQQKNGDSIALFWVGLLTLAGECNDKGMIYITPTVPYTYEGLAGGLGFPLPVVKKAIPLFVSLDMLEESEGFLCIVNWNEHQNVDGLEKAKVSKLDRSTYMREYMREYMRKKRASPNEPEEGEESGDSLDNVKQNVKQNVKHSLDNVKKEEKVPQKEENKEGEEEKEYSGVCTRIRAYWAPETTLKIAIDSLFEQKFSRFPSNEELSNLSSIFDGSLADLLTEDQHYLLTVAFESAANAGKMNTAYILGVFKNLKLRGIDTKEKYEADRKRFAIERRKREANNPSGGEASYGDSEDFYQAALRAGGGV